MINKLFKLALNNIPRPILIRLSYGVQAVAPIFLKGDTFIDPIDGRGYRKFFPYGYGEHQRENALSPGTNSLERHRLLWLYLKEETDFFTAPKKVLHIAPEQCFYGRFRKMKNLDYTTADLNSPLADISLDVQDMKLPDNTYDVVFCNHVHNKNTPEKEKSHAKRGTKDKEEKKTGDKKNSGKPKSMR